MAICIIMARDSCGFDRKMAVKIQRHICEYRISFRERLVGITLLNDRRRGKKREISIWKLGGWMMVPFTNRRKSKKQLFRMRKKSFISRFKYQIPFSEN